MWDREEAKVKTLLNIVSLNIAQNQSFVQKGIGVKYIGIPFNALQPLYLQPSYSLLSNIVWLMLLLYIFNIVIMLVLSQIFYLISIHNWILTDFIIYPL